MRVIEASDSDSSNDVVEASDSDSDNDVPLVSLNKQAKSSTDATVISSDSDNADDGHESDHVQTDDDDNGEINDSDFSPNVQDTKLAREGQDNSEEVIDLVDSDSEKEDYLPSPPRAQPVAPHQSSGKKYTQEDLREIEQKIQQLTSVIKRNEYDSHSSRLPDGGNRLRQVIQEDRRKLAQLREILVKARQQQSATAKTFPIFKNSAAPIKNELVGASSSQDVGAISAQLSQARQRVANLRRAASTASQLPDKGVQLMMKLGEAEKEVRRWEEKLNMVNVKAAAAVTNEAWEAQRRAMEGFGMSEQERARMLQEFGANNIYGGRMSEQERARMLQEFGANNIYG